MGEVANARIMTPLSSFSDSNTVMESGGSKRKTPSELRVEQFKRMRVVSNGASTIQLIGEKLNDGIVSEPKKVELSKPPRYIDTRVPDIYPVTKPGDRIKLLGSKDKFKDPPLFQNQIKELDQNSTLSNAKLSSKLTLRRTGYESLSDDPNVSMNGKCTNENAEQSTKPENHKFRNVAELSSSSQAFSSAAAIDMNKALKGLANNKGASILTPTHGSPDSLDNLGPNLSGSSFGHELQVPGEKVPLDLTLKVGMRLVSSSSLKWCHRLNTSSELMGMKEFIFSYDSMQDKSHVHTNISSSFTQVGASFCKALHSWVHPQSTLPPSLISTMALSAARGGAVEDDFLSKRLSSWEDSFRSIYYMFRKRMCNIFYFCTQQFIVMFVGGGLTENKENRSVAYLSRSTRGLRALLKKHDVYFSMPLCGAEVEQATTEDLHELSEFEKTNPGQTRVVDSLADIDNSSQSLLAFVGNDNVHGLYDFLLNHRALLSSVACVDVPVLYSPVPFENASLHLPKVNYKEMRRLDATHKASLGGAIQETNLLDKKSLSSTDMSYTIEIKDSFLPPWVISKVCATIAADGKSFESTFVTEPLSDGLNIALDSYCCKGDIENLELEKINLNGSLKDAVLNPSLRSAVLKHLKFINGSYLASLSYI